MAIMNVIIKNVFFLVLLMPVFFLHGQATGYLGKKFIVKTNLLNGRMPGFNNCDIEYVLKRKLSINVGIQFFNYSRDSQGLKVRTGRVKPESGSPEFKEYSILSNGNSKGWIGNVGCKIYFDRIIPAPNGWYTEFSLGFGSATFKDYDVSYEYKVVRGTATMVPKKAVSGLSGSAKIIYFEAPAFGCQKVFNSYISLDGKISLQGQYGALSDELLNNFEHNYFLRGNTISYAYGRLLLCPAIYLKLGILIF
jgi:hypothetical protein